MALSFRDHKHYIDFLEFLPADKWTCTPSSVDQIKGFTRTCAVALILIAAAELDHTDAATADKLRPIHKTLDKCWLLPCHVFWQLQCVSFCGFLSSESFDWHDFF